MMHMPKLRRERGTDVAELAAAATEGTGTEDATTSSRSELCNERRKVQYLHLLIELFRQVENIVLVGLKITFFKFCMQPSEPTKSISSIVAMAMTMVTPVSSLTQLERHSGLGDNDNSLIHLSKCKDLSVVGPRRRSCEGCLVVITDHGPQAEVARALRHELLVDSGEGRLEGLEEERQKREEEEIGEENNYQHTHNAQMTMHVWSDARWTT